MHTQRDAQRGLAPRVHFQQGQCIPVDHCQEVTFREGLEPTLPSGAPARHCCGQGDSGARKPWHLNTGLRKFCMKEEVGPLSLSAVTALTRKSSNNIYWGLSQGQVLFSSCPVHMFLTCGNAMPMRQVGTLRGPSTPA